MFHTHREARGGDNPCSRLRWPTHNPARLKRRRPPHGGHNNNVRCQTHQTPESGQLTKRAHLEDSVVLIDQQAQRTNMQCHPNLSHHPPHSHKGHTCRAQSYNASSHYWSNWSKIQPNSPRLPQQWSTHRQYNLDTAVDQPETTNARNIPWAFLSTNSTTQQPIDGDDCTIGVGWRLGWGKTIQRETLRCKYHYTAPAKFGRDLFKCSY
jgi:hypothetical protein